MQPGAEDKDAIEMIKKESETNDLFYYDIHREIKRYKIQNNPRKQRIINKIKEEGYVASETHFLPTAVKTDIPHEKFLEIIKDN